MNRGPLNTEGTVIWADPPERQKPGELIAHGLRFSNFRWSISLALSVVLADAGEGVRVRADEVWGGAWAGGDLGTSWLR